MTLVKGASITGVRAWHYIHKTLAYGALEGKENMKKI